MNENICPFLEINKTTYGAWCQVTFPPCPYISRTETHRTNVELNERCCHLSDSAYTDVKNLVAKLKTLHQPTEIEVINLHTCKDFGTREGDVLCDRRTKWGNPFKMNKESERDEVCDKYKVYIDKMLAEGHLNLDELKNARRLGCWDSPKRCHCDYLRELILKNH